MDGMEWRGREQVLDVGCGDGSLTALLASRLPAGQVLGIDSSEDMIAHAHATHPVSRFPNLRFLKMALGSLCELETQVILAIRLGFTSGDDMATSMNLIRDVDRLLSALIRAVRRSKVDQPE